MPRADPKPACPPSFRRWLLAGLLLALPVWAGEPYTDGGGEETSQTGQRRAPAPLPDPGPRDACPVCGMFVTKYPDWTATLVWQDGQAVHFDGVKDLFKYLHDLPRYAKGRPREEIAVMAVTEYYGLKRIDARQAWYVLGSDVIGPMGRELIPLASEDEAREFMSDHGGKTPLRFADVTPGHITFLDAGAPP